MKHSRVTVVGNEPITGTSSVSFPFRKLWTSEHEGHRIRVVKGLLLSRLFVDDVCLDRRVTLLSTSRKLPLLAARIPARGPRVLMLEIFFSSPFGGRMTIKVNGRSIGSQPDALTEADMHYLLDHFFMASVDNMIRPHARYYELYLKRGLGVDSVEKAAPRFSKRDIRDLQIWSNLSWMHEIAFEQDKELAAFRDKGRNWSESEKNWLLDKQLDPSLC